MSRDGYPDDGENDTDTDGATDSGVPYTGYLPVGGGWGWGWLPIARGDVASENADGDYVGDAPTEDTPDEGYVGDASGEDGGSWWEEGVITVILITGVVLFLFPEPATSMLGIVLIVIGVVAWLVDAFT